MAWTKEQQLAIDTRDRTLLVSAAAGSGKTATLTERIIQSILDDKDPRDIGRMLIVTFTNAAVDELRERIGRAIKKAALENPKNTRLEEQLLRLKDAKILTITAFCNSILRMSAENVGLTPSYRIAEPAEAGIIASSILDGLIDAAFENELTDVCSADEFIELADCLAGVKYSEALSESIKLIFEKLTSAEKGIDALLPLVEEYDPDKFASVEATRIGAYLTKYVHRVLSEYRDIFGRLQRRASDAKLDTANLERLCEYCKYIDDMSRCESYNKMRELTLAFSPRSVYNSGKLDPTDFFILFKNIRKYFSDDIKKFKDIYFLYSEEEWRDSYTKLYKLLSIFYKFLKKFYSVFMEVKRKRGICEFSDVERYAYEALWDEGGEKTELAHDLSRKFDAIYVDEYQDVNSLQAKVFEAIATDTNRFMVGDIKQSIYGFRAAKPEIFADMKRTYPAMGNDGDHPFASIFMSSNFRCDRAVVDFVNGIFDTAFGLTGEGIGYASGDKLEFSKIYPDGHIPVGIPPEIHVIEKPSLVSSGSDPDTLPDEMLEEESSSADAMARCLVAKISELLKCGKKADGTPIKPEDIAILLRSVNGKQAAAISRALERERIAADITDSSDLFMCDEVLLALSYLYSIDNPHKDVYLVALMCSPLFGFTADELTRIKKETDCETVWDALTEYVRKNPSYTRGKDLIATLTGYRRLSEGMSTDALLSLIYRESGLLALAEKSGGRDNLMLLHNHARKYEESDFKGLYSFISYVNMLIENEESYPSAKTRDNVSSVKIMTVHKSKGLEFPVCFVVSPTPGGGNEGRITFDEGFGIAMKYKDDSGLALVDNPARQIIRHYMAEREFEEELRVLYVALTRAREQLYVYGVCPLKSTDEYMDGILTTRDNLSDHILRGAKGLLEVILLTASCGKTVIESDRTDIHHELDESVASSSESKDVNEVTEKHESESASAEEYLSRFTFEHELSHLEALPEKVSVSRLSPTVLDTVEDSSVGIDELLRIEGILTDEATEENEIESEGEQKQILPSFMTGTSSAESAKRGIATHTVLQFCDLEKIEANGTRAELKRLTDLKFISEEDMNRVRINEIDRFIASQLFSEMKAASKLYRELRFNVKLPASLFTADEVKGELLSDSEILVQGVIDCIIEDAKGNLHLIDYKTDRLTREELADTRLGEERLIAAHRLQLSYYRRAIEIMFGRLPKRVGIYSLHLGREISVDF
ncbi:MAG: hypothetical protein E7617_01520 [Ruminococcaceae bacterium]|nr:hypothetical protein [Oscillospiraceae bacterium]